MYFKNEASLHPLDLPDNQAGRLSQNQREWLRWRQAVWFVASGLLLIGAVIVWVRAADAGLAAVVLVVGVFAGIGGLYERPKFKTAGEVGSVVGLFGKAVERGDDDPDRYLMVLGREVIAINADDWNRLPQGWLRVYFLRDHGRAVNAEIILDPAERKVDWQELASTLRRMFDLEVRPSDAMTSRLWAGINDNKAGAHALVERIALGERWHWDPSESRSKPRGSWLPRGRSSVATRMEELLVLADSEANPEADAEA